VDIPRGGGDFHGQHQGIKHERNPRHGAAAVHAPPTPPPDFLSEFFFPLFRLIHATSRPLVPCTQIFKDDAKYGTIEDGALAVAFFVRVDVGSATAGADMRLAAWCYSCSDMETLDGGEDAKGILVPWSVVEQEINLPTAKDDVVTMSPYDGLWGKVSPRAECVSSPCDLWFVILFRSEISFAASPNSGNDPQIYEAVESEADGPALKMLHGGGAPFAKKPAKVAAPSGARTRQQTGTTEKKKLRSAAKPATAKPKAAEKAAAKTRAGAKAGKALAKPKPKPSETAVVKRLKEENAKLQRDLLLATGKVRGHFWRSCKVLL
jgi:hypothetical protein